MTVRDTIVLKTQELMYQKGYGATSISDIMTAADVGKGQLYHYFSSKKEIGLAATSHLLEAWEKELFTAIFQSDMPASEKFSAMLDWVYDFHRSQEGNAFHGCPVGNLIVELSAQEEDFRLLLQDFMEEWQSYTADILADLHADWSKEKAWQEAQQVLASIQGAIILLKVSQDLTVIESAIADLKEKYL